MVQRDQQRLGSAGTQVPSLVLHSQLGMQCCRSCRLGLKSDPRRRSSTCFGEAKKEKKKQQICISLSPFLPIRLPAEQGPLFPLAPTTRPPSTVLEIPWPVPAGAACGSSRELSRAGLGGQEGEKSTELCCPELAPILPGTFSARTGSRIHFTSGKNEQFALEANSQVMGSLNPSSAT